MITWLFTQVWLWSLASFVLGALMTWALFVRPARRRLKRALERTPLDYGGYHDEYGGYYDDAVYDDPDHIYPAFDERDLEDRTARFDEDERADQRLEEDPLDLVTEQTEQSPPPAEPRRYAPMPQAAPGDEPTLAKFDRSPQGPWVPAEAPPQPEPEAAEPEPEVAEPGPERAAPSGNTWFRRWDEEQTTEAPDPDPAMTAIQPRVPEADPGTTTREPAEESATTEAGEGERQDDLSGQLRSLFEPVEGGNPAGETGYIPPVGADATAVLPKVPQEQPNRDSAGSHVAGDLNGTGQADRTDADLPRRTPARQGNAPQVEPPRIPEALRQRAEAPKRRPTPEEQTGEPGTGGPANIKPAENLSQDANLPRRTPGTNPLPGGELAGNGPMIKGHSASRQYHSPDSPQYDDIVADVWFRTPADAETAGFSPWHGRRN